MGLFVAIGEMSVIDAALMFVLNGALLLLGVVVLAKAWSFSRDARHLHRSLVQEPENQDDKADQAARWKALAWLVSEQGYSLRDVKRINFQANLRDRLGKIKLWNELLPVGGFFGTVVPLAWFFFNDPTSRQESLAKAIIPTLGTALLTTVIGMFFFIIVALILGKSEELVGVVERDVDSRAEKEFAHLADTSAAPKRGETTAPAGENE